MFSPNWHPVNELCGYITEDGELVHLPNLADDPTNNFSFDKSLLPDNVATLWHSHPSNDCNLSVEDYLAFLQFPQYNHRIYAKNTCIEYYVRNNMVYQRES